MSSTYPESSLVTTEPSTQSNTPSKATPLVSIIIGNYNYDRFVGQAIESALNQTYPHVEVIVVDDGSTDRSREVIREYGDRVIPIFKENGGQPSNYNAGFIASRGEVICFLDSDDLFLPNKAEEIVKILQSSEQLGWCFHSLQLIDQDDRPLSITTTENYPTCEFDLRSRIQSGRIPPYPPPSSCLCFRRSLLEKILPMPTHKLITNNDYYVKFMAMGLSKGFILGEPLTLQKIHDSNAATLRSDRHHLNARKYIYTGIWVNQEFPEFRKFANKLLAVGTFLNWKAGNNDHENQMAIQGYMSSRSPLEKAGVHAKALYYYLKDRVRGR